MYGPPITETLRALVQERLALDCSRHDDAWLSRVLQDETESQVGLSPDAYLSRLQTEELSSSLWASLVDRLTIAETYFYRDEGQIELLRSELLPQLLREASGRRLRIWSAGCSSGEELYTLAILLENLGLSDFDLLGTDVNPAVLEQARSGRYRERSLRKLPDSVLQRHFQIAERGRVLAPRHQARARFQVHNLAGPTGWPRPGMDLIVCRNVLIYFARKKLPEILDQFFKTLRPGGYLLTGHGELLTVKTPFEVVQHPGSLVYRRPVAPAARLHQERSGSSKIAAKDAASRDMAEKDICAVPRPQILEPEAFCLLAREARERGEKGESRDLLRKALYLDPDSVLAYLEWGLLLANEDLVTAKKRRDTALSLLARNPSAESSPRVRAALKELERALP